MKKTIEISSVKANYIVKVKDWLNHFSHCVRIRDFEGGINLFSPDVYSFGTRAEIVKGLDDLVENQWKHIWLNTEDFHFLEDSIYCIPSADQSSICTLALWESKSINELNQLFLRRGRCTITLMANQTAPYGYWAVHSHFSKVPSLAL
jgi:hypothetical protein